MGRIRDLFRSKARISVYEPPDDFRYTSPTYNQPVYQQASASTYVVNTQPYQVPRYLSAPTPSISAVELPSPTNHVGHTSIRTPSSDYTSPAPSYTARARAPSYSYTNSQGSGSSWNVPHNQSFATPPPTLNELPSPLSSYNRTYSHSSSNTTTSTGLTTPATSNENSTGRGSAINYRSSSAVSAGYCFTCPDCPPNYLGTVKDDGNNPNRSRRFRKCTKNSEHWNGFADNRGLNPGNPLCRCQNQSRLVSKNMQNRNTGLWETFYSCQDGGCKFYESYATFTKQDIERMIRMSAI